MRLVWTAIAVTDLEQISDYVFEKNPELAATTIRHILESASELKLFPRQAAQAARKGRGN
jgi:plasmid stabilization system protein ParE